MQRPEEITEEAWAMMGAARRRAVVARAGEVARLAEILNRATPPKDCGPAIPVAPARGACRVFTVREVFTTGEILMPIEDDSYTGAVIEGGYRGRSEATPRRAVRIADVWDRIEVKARAAGKPMPFAPHQVKIARHYRTLVERQSAGAVKLSSLEGRTGGCGAGALDVTDLRLAEARDLDAMRRRIGTGAAMVVRRVRPSARGPGASIILDRRLVDAVCLEDMDLSAVLQAHGWAKSGRHMDRLREALSDALDRMRASG